MTLEETTKRIEELEKRLRELEARPVYVPQPIYVPSPLPVNPVAPYWNPIAYSVCNKLPEFVATWS